MSETKIEYKPIGIIHSPFKAPKGTPIQSTSNEASNAMGTIEIFKYYVPGLKDLLGFSHIILLYHFDRAKSCELQKKPFMDVVPRGIFSIRAPSRPNPIGFSILELVDIVEENKLIVKGIDILDKTPLLDIKPYVPEFDSRKKARIGWLQDNIQKVDTTKDDGRFSSAMRPASFFERKKKK